MRSHAVVSLKKFLDSVGPGLIVDIDAVERLVVGAWSSLRGAGEERTTADKLVGRIEDLSWDPPILSFKLERHGGTVNGSTRAELHYWEVDVEESTASIVKRGRRQIHRCQPAVRVKPIAAELVDALLSGRDDHRLKRLSADRVRLKMDEILPSAGSYKQTVAGRRKRLHQELEVLLRPHGWRRALGGSTYVREAPDTTGAESPRAIQ